MSRFLPWPLSVLLAAALSAALLVVLFLVYQLHGRWPNDARPQKWQADAFTVVQGNGAVADGVMHLHASPGQQAVAVVDHVDLQTRDYPYVRLAIEHWPPGTDVSLLWVTRAAPRKVHWIVLPWHTRLVRLADNPHWHGDVTAIGLAINGVSKAAKLSWQSVSAEPVTPFGALHAVFAQWTTFEPWSLRSNNFIVGGERSQIVSPVVAIAAWVGLAMLLYIAVALVGRKRADWKVIAALLTLGWLTLDAGWQFNLIRQLTLTHSQYAGKSQVEKHRVEIGGRIFGFMQQIKQRLPAKPVRIFVLINHPDGKNKFYRLKALYDLLPENVYAYSQYPPPPRLLHAGDYLVTMGRIPGLSVDTASGLMRWQKRQLQVRRVFASDGDALYEVR